MITLEVKALRAAVAEAATVVISKTAEPLILANALIVAGSGGLELTATDLDMWISHHVDVVEGSAMRATVGAKLLDSIARKLPPEVQVVMQLAEGGGKMIVTAGRSKFTLPTLPAEDFPMLVDESWDAQFEISAFDLAQLIDAVAFAISTEEARYYLNGIYLHAPDDRGAQGEMLMRAAATDGHRLARYQLPLPDGAASLPGAGVIIPRKAVGLIRKLCDTVRAGLEDGAASPLIELAISSSRIRAESGGTVLTSKLIDGTFPDYVRVIPTGNDKVMTVDKEELREAVDRVSVVDTGKSRIMKASVRARSEANGSATEDLSIALAPKGVGGGDGATVVAELAIGFNSKYLLDILQHIPGSSVVAELGDPQAPVLIRDPDCDKQLYVLMPARV